MKERRYDIDWLRVLVMLAVFLFHCARFFGGGTWHLNNNEESIVALLFIGWLDMWFMPLFFLLSGIGSWYALQSRNKHVPIHIDLLDYECSLSRDSFFFGFPNS